MASPQLKNGYTQIANEILEALARNRLSGQERQIIDVIFRKTYGFGKTSDHISMSQFAKLTGIKRPLIARLLKGLLHKMILRVTQNDNRSVNSYCFIKDYSKWKVLHKKITAKKQSVTQKDNTPKNENHLELVASGKEGVTQNDTYKRKKIKKERKKFIKPLIPEIRKYCEERNNTILPEAFYDHHEANGWIVGKTPMKDWQATIRNWERRQPTPKLRYDEAKP